MSKFLMFKQFYTVLYYFLNGASARCAEHVGFVFFGDHCQLLVRLLFSARSEVCVVFFFCSFAPPEHSDLCFF